MGTKILVVSHDVVSDYMAGPGIRYFHLARVLSTEFDVTLAAPHLNNKQNLTSRFNTVWYEKGKWDSLKNIVRSVDVVVASGEIITSFPALNQEDVVLVIDGYDPLLAEWFSLHHNLDIQQQYEQWYFRISHLNQQYLAGDFFLCASERQRYWWLGLLESNGRINPYTYRDDSTGSKLLGVVPYGLPNSKPVHTHNVIKGVWNGISKTDKVVLWGGGLWPWLDPLTAIRAINLVKKEYEDIKLVFPGTKHPNPDVAQIYTHTNTAKREAKRLGILNRSVFFGDWIPYDNWQNVLLESDIALSLHFDTLETQLAFRSRVLDYIWAELPMIVTKGDATSDMVQQYAVGKVVDFEDEQSVAQAIILLLKQNDTLMKKGFEEAKNALTWENAAKPLIEFCRDPRKALDKTMIRNVGNPFYLQRIEKCEKLVDDYRRGRFIRFMRWVNAIRERYKIL